MISRALHIGLALAILPSAALAEICDKERPYWSPADGPATGLDELFHIATTLPGLGILGAFTLALLTGRKLYFGVAALFSGIVCLGLWYESRSGLHALGRAEGCVGDLTLTIWVLATLTLIAFGSLSILWLRRSGQNG